jgi:hypothetical protein
MSAVLPATASSATLAQRVAKLEAKMACVVRVPTATFFDYAWYHPVDILEGDGVTVTPVMGDPFGAPNYALAWTYGTGVAPDAWMLGIRNTSTCRSRFPALADPVFARASARAAQAKARFLR